MRCDWMEAAKIVREWGTGLGVVPSWAQLSLTYQSSELPGCCCPWEPIHFHHTEKFSPMASREVPASPLIQSAFEQCAPLACLQLYIDSKSIESSEPKERKRMMKSPPNHKTTTNTYSEFFQALTLKNQNGKRNMSKSHSRNRKWRPHLSLLDVRAHTLTNTEEGD